MFIDIHCHLNSQSRLICKKNEILVSTAISKEDIKFHFENNIPYWIAGIHPKDFYLNVDDFFSNTPLKKILAIGEIGFDRNYHNIEKQKIVLKNQICLAKKLGLPIIIHLVGREYDFIKIIKESNFQNMIIIHAFNSSYEVYKELDKLGCFFSLGKRIFYNKKQYKQVADILQKKRFFFETDCNYSRLDDNITDIYQLFATYFSLDVKDLITITEHNFKLLRKEYGTI